MPFTMIEGSVLLYDANGNPLSVSNGDPLGLTTGVAVVGSDGANFRFLRTATDGTVRVDPTGTTAQPVVQGTAAALAGAWPVQVTDGTNTQPTGDVAARALYQQITDGTNGPVAVKTAGADGASNTENSLSTLARLAGLNGVSTWDRLRAGITTVSATLTGMLNVLPWAVYNTTPTVRTNGQGGPLQSDVNGSLVISGADTANGLISTALKPVVGPAYSWTRYQNLGAAATANVKASAGNVFSAYCQNNSAATRYLQLFNTATTPSAGAVPLFTFLIPASGVVLIDGSFFGQGGYYFSTGIAFALSTTQTTYTAASATDHATHLMYV